MNAADSNVLPLESRTDNTTSNTRIASLDQFRGYAVAGMVLVNFLGNYSCAPRILRHTNDYCSYADTIMPNFLFAVGFSIAVVWARALAKETQGEGISPKSLNTQVRRKAARPLQLKLARRSLLLMVFAFLLYFPWETPN